MVEITRAAPRESAESSGIGTGLLRLLSWLVASRETPSHILDLLLCVLCSAPGAGQQTGQPRDAGLRSLKPLLQLLLPLTPKVTGQPRNRPSTFHSGLSEQRIRVMHHAAQRGKIADSEQPLSKLKSLLLAAKKGVLSH